MTLTDYQREASRTTDPNRSQRDRLSNAALGLAGESGEVIELVKKHLHHDHDLDPAKLARELGDVLWYVAEMCTVLGLKLEEVGKEAAHYASALPPKGLNAAAIGLSRYSGELSELVLSVLEFRTAIEPMQAFRRSVSFLTYLMHLCTYAGTTLEAVAEANVAKLRERYPGGFSPAASVARVDVVPPLEVQQASGEWVYAYAITTVWRHRRGARYGWVVCGGLVQWQKEGEHYFGSQQFGTIDAAISALDAWLTSGTVPGSVDPHVSTTPSVADTLAELAAQVAQAQASEQAAQGRQYEVGVEYVATAQDKAGRRGQLDESLSTPGSFGVTCRTDLSTIAYPWTDHAEAVAMLTRWLGPDARKATDVCEGRR